MDKAKGIVAALLGLALLPAVARWAWGALPPFPPHSYTLEWFLRLPPEEIDFYVRYALSLIHI